MKNNRKTYEQFYSEFSPSSITFTNNDIEEHKYKNDSEDSCDKLVIDPIKDADAISQALSLVKKIGF